MLKILNRAIIKKTIIVFFKLLSHMCLCLFVYFYLDIAYFCCTHVGIQHKSFLFGTNKLRDRFIEIHNWYDENYTCIIFSE